MPRRSNYLQKLVFALERQIAGQAKIEQSPMLRDRVTGQEREVDIVISGQVGRRLVLVGIEVTSTRADVGWVDEMIGRHRNLPTNKLVLFSKGGFSDGALGSAGAAGVETVTLEEPDEADWTKVCGKLSKVYLAIASLAPRTGTATLKTRRDLSLAVGPETMLYLEDGKSVGSFQDLASAYLGKADVLERLYEREDRKDLKTFTAEITLPAGLCMKDKAGGLHEVLSLKLVGDCTYEDRLINITSSRYRGAHVAHGSASLDNRDLALVVTESREEPLKASIIVYKGENDPGEVLDLTPRGDNGMAVGHTEEDADECSET